MKKYLHFDMIRILKENTDQDHPMKQKDLIAELRKKDEKINRTTVWNALSDLIANSLETRVHHLGETDEAEEARDTRQYFTNIYYDQEFTDAELRWLIDGILYSRNVPHAERDVIIGKLCELGNKHFQKHMNMKKIRRLSDNIIDSIKEIKERIGLDEKVFSKPALNNTRQLGLLSKAKESLLKAKEDALNDLTVDLIATSLFDAYTAILEILGEANQIDLSKEIFARFCVGK